MYNTLHIHETTLKNTIIPFLNTKLKNKYLHLTKVSSTAH